MPIRFVNLNGKILGPNELEKARVSVFDRSFMYGDSLYEVVRTYQGKAFAMDAHLSRLDRSAQLCRFDLAHTLDHYREEMIKTIDAYRSHPDVDHHAEVYCRIIISRGDGQIGFSKKLVENPGSYVIITQQLKEPSAEQFEIGIKLLVSSRIRNDPKALDPAAKSGNYLNNLLAFLEAEERGVDDAILCNGEGHVTEGTVFNVFYVNRGIVATPPLNIGILGGISRDIVLSIVRDHKIPFREVRFPKEYMYSADEVFITGTTKEVFPVVELDGLKIADGKPGPITRRLKEAFRKRALST